MITRPKTRLTPTSPSAPLRVALVTTAPQPAKTSAKAASPSATERRSRSGRSGIDRVERHADDRQPARQPLQREAADVARPGSDLCVAHAQQSDSAPLAVQAHPAWLQPQA